jgi:MYXO-CTERM domain-containing protein
MRPSRRFWTVALAALLAVGLPQIAAAETGVFLDAGDTAADTLDASDVGDIEVGDVDADAADLDATDADAADTTDAGDTDGDTTDVGDTGGDPTDAGMDAGDTQTVDTGVDVGDTGGADTADAKVDAGDTGLMTDAASDADAGALSRFFGRVDVEGLEDDSGVEIVLERTDGDEEWSRTTGADGTFAFDGLENGAYSVQLTKPEFVTISETFQLNGDRQVRYTMFRDQEVDLRVEAVFPDAETAPDGVRFNLEGPRGPIQPGGAIAVEGNSATWSVENLGVGTWTIQAAAPGFRTTSFQFAVESFDGGMTQHDIRLFMVEGDIEVPPPEGGCGCASSTDGSPAPSMMWIVFGLVGVVTMRRRRRS